MEGYPDVLGDGAMEELVAAAELALLAGCPTRLEILLLLASGECTVGEIKTALGLSYQLASNHLKAMREAGLVMARRDGQHRQYCLSSRCTLSERDGLVCWAIRCDSGCELVISVPISRGLTGGGASLRTYRTTRGSRLANGHE